MSLQAYALLANTAIIALVIGVIVFAGLRFAVGLAEEPLSQSRRW